MAAPPLHSRWFPLKGLEDIRLYSGFRPVALADLPDTPRHLGYRDE